ncbi:MAG TPA: hypothetical protein VHO90_00445, partial [Bacteroidales bacterium]|nr:hypothetical protein [Bacteroidales bacterium]
LGCNWDFVLPGAGTLEIISTSVNVPGTTDFLFRYVLIPGNILLKMQNLGINADELKKMPYNDLVNKLGSAGK